MVRGNIFGSSAIFAISAAMLCGTPSALAQETVASPVIVTPTVAPTEAVAPPPVILTVPDLVPAEPVVEADKPVTRPRTATPVRAGAKAAPKSAPVIVPSINTESGGNADTSISSPPLVDDVTPLVSTVDDSETAEPLVQSKQPEIADSAQDDWIVYGGFAAALGLAGLGAAYSRRRGRNRAAVSAEPTYLVPTKKEMTPPSQPLAVERAAPRIMQPTVADRQLPPVTDPLFAYQPVLKPVTDPLFAQHMALPPVTDPLFSDKSEYAGRMATFDSRRSWPAAALDEWPRPELEPAE